MISSKLAFRNVKKSFRDYTIYFLTLTFGVCIFFIFNSIESQQAIMDLTAGQMGIMKMLDRVMVMFSVFVAVILGALILYANRFLIKRRKKEFGIYMTLGMEKGIMSRILIKETVFVGFISLCVGLILGVFLSQGMAVLTAKLLGTALGEFKFIFSTVALWRTILCFGVVFLLTLIFNVFSIRKQKLISLIYADRKNEAYKSPRLRLSVMLFLVAVICLGVAYFLISDNGILGAQTFNTSIALGVVGTFLFFFSLSGFFLKVMQQNKKMYLRNLNMFVLRQINSKINTTYVSMTLVCLMLFVAISTLSSGIGVAKIITADLEKNIPFDASLSVGSAEDDMGRPISAYEDIDLIGALEAKGIDFDSFAKTYWTSRFYVADESVKRNIGANLLDADPQLMKLSDFNTLLKHQGIDPIALKSDEFALDSSLPVTDYQTKLRELVESNPSITVGGAQLKTNDSLLYKHALRVTQNPSMSVTIVVNDALLQDAQPLKDILQIVYRGEDDAYEKQCRKALAGVYLSENTATYLETGEGVRETSNTATTTIAYLAIYLGIVFLITSAAVLAIAQLSEANDNISRYGLLRKIGTDDRMINKALFRQIFIYFGVPLFLALVHSAVGISVANKFGDGLGEGGGIIGSSLFMILIVLIIYGGYFVATYMGSRNMITKSYLKKR
jgi:putative ABC transport system permease protein